MTTFLFLLAAAAAAVWTPQTSGSDAELRGLAVADAKHAWASGAGGTVLRTTDGQKWEKLTVPGGEDLDFRDIELLADNELVLMAAGPGPRSKIYRTNDAGTTWKIAHMNPDKDGFYDAIAFWDKLTGLVVGDPVGGKFQVRVTSNGGRTWYPVKDAVIPPALEGEGLFAASGTCLYTLKGKSTAWFVTGGAKVSRVFTTTDAGHTWTVVESPVKAGNASSGLFSVAFLDEKRGVAAGGDYKQPTFEGLNGVRSEDGGKKWIAAALSPKGFFSGLAVAPDASRILAVGLAGTAETRDAGKTWTVLDKAPLNSVAFGSDGSAWAVGPKGTIVKRAIR